MAQLVDDAVDVNQNGLEQPLEVLANDVFGEEYTGQRRITSVSFGSEGGRVEIAADGRAIDYAPPADFAGTENFAYFVDNRLSATVTVTVSSPLAADGYEFPPDGQVRVLDVLANDPFWPGYGDLREITFVSQTSLGSEVAIADDGKSILYTPARDAFGKDALVYIVDDLYPAQVTIEVPNPLKNDRYLEIVQNSENNVLGVLGNDFFWPGYSQPGKITFVTEPTSGATLTIATDGKTLSYTPPDEFSGRDNFTYVVDGVYEAHVNLQVRRPVQDDRFEMDIGGTDHPLDLTANDHFSYWDRGRWIERDVVDRVTSVGETAEGGTVTIMAHGQGVLYSAPAGFEGTDTFEYIADGKHKATVTVNVTRPVRGDSRTVYEDHVNNRLDVLLNDFMGNGYNGPGIITSVAEAPVSPRFPIVAADWGQPGDPTPPGETVQRGSMTIAPDGKWLVYTPAPGYTGVDVFSYTVDGDFEATVRVSVKSAVTNDYIQLDPDPSATEYSLYVMGNDHFGWNYPGPGVITAVGAADNGGRATISENGRFLLFVPADGSAGRFTYTVDDKYEASVSVSFRNFLSGDSIVVDQNSVDKELTPLENDFRSRSSANYRGPRRITAVGLPEQGGNVTLAADGQTLWYRPAADFFGTDRFTYTVDGLMRAWVTVNVIRRVRDDAYRVDPGSRDNSLAVLVNDLFGANYSGAGRVTAVAETSQGGTAAVGEDGKSIYYTPPAGFTGQEKFVYTVDGALKAEVTVSVAESVSGRLPRFDSPEAFEEFLLDEALQRYEGQFGQEYRYTEYPGELYSDSGMVSFASTAGERIYSETNVQVAGVDEGDIIETDGDYLYILTDREVIIANAWPAEELAIASRLTVEGTPIAEYLHGDRLTVISRTSYERPYEWDRLTVMPPQRWRVETMVTVYDVSDRGSPTVVQKTVLDGGYVESRRIDDYVFLVQRNYTNLRLPGPLRIDDPPESPVNSEPVTPEPISVDGIAIDSSLISPSLIRPGLIRPGLMPRREITGVYESSEQYLQRMKAEIGGFIERAMPHYASFGPDGELVRTGSLGGPEDLYQTLRPETNTLVSVVSMNISSDQPGIVASTGIFTSGADEIYGSLDNLYVFDQQYTSEDGTVTQILKFDWDAETGGVEFVVKGQVPGRLLNQFSADEFDGYVRIATTITNRRSGNWSSRSENVLFVLRDDRGVLEFVGSMQNLALEETIRSVRFMGRRAFVTTFRDIDPLFVLDLSDPANPRPGGHITMPGYNSYMQLIDETHLLTVGRNTTITGSGPTQVSLFDVEDLSRPRMIDQYTFQRFSTSEAEVDHHAFGWFAEHQVLAMPSERSYWERVDEDGDGYRESRRRVREHELITFKIDVTASRRSGDGIQLLGRIEHDSPVRRSVFIEDVLYSVANDSAEAVSIVDPTLSYAKIEFESQAPDEPPDGGEVPIVPQPSSGPVAIDLAVVDYRRLDGIALAGEPTLLDFKPMRNGILTVAAHQITAVDNLELTLLDDAGNQLATAQPSQPVTADAWQYEWRFDRAVVAGSTYRLRLTGDGAVINLRLANLLRHEGTTVTVYGTGGDDVFEFDASRVAAPLTVTIHGIAYAWEDAAVDLVSFDGGGGSDTALLHGSPGDETATLDPGSAAFRGETFEVHVAHTADVTIFGEGGFDTAVLNDSAGNDNFVGMSDYAAIYGDGFYNRVRSFRSVVAEATGGVDVGKLFDSPGNDNYVATPTYNEISGERFKIVARDFDGMHAYATAGGVDVAKFYDSVADDDYVATPTYAALFGDGFYNRAKFFEGVHAYATAGGRDVARFYDSPADDDFIASPTYAALYNATYRQAYTQGFYNRAKFFEAAHAFATAGGDDVARLYDSAEDDVFYADPLHGAMFRPGEYYNRAKFFDRVHAFATAGGNDEARLHGSDNDDQLYADSTESSLYRPGEYYHRAKFFETVKAYAHGGGNDRAHLADLALDDLFEAEDSGARLTYLHLDALQWITADDPSRTPRSPASPGNALLRLLKLV